MTQQLPLCISLREEARFENFYSGGNQEIVETLQQAIREQHAAMIYCWGQRGCGLSHLLQACCHAAAEHGVSAVYLPLRELPQLNADIFQGLESIDVVCVDDIGVIAKQSEAEEAVFDCYNRLRDAGKLFIAAAHVPVVELGLQLPDLVSRLLWGLVFHVNSLDDSAKVHALRLRAKHRGFEMPNDVAQYIITRGERDMASLFSMLDRLDYASLAEQRKMTIPFVKKVLFDLEKIQVYMPPSAQ